ncbi:FAD-binding oxidoreductase [Emcibacter nanhaiensis]|uniref:FAD-binding oxidoreductase n=1 Tax=Emcibacter nanhaiensis TaxID=1505037 RepID=UPI00319EA880
MVENSGTSFECGEEDTLLRAALRAGIAFPYECNVGQCGSCRFEVLEGEVRSLWAEAPALTPRDHRKGLKLGCQSRPVSDCRIKVRLDQSCLPLFQPLARDAELVSIRDVTHDMREFSFKTAEQARFAPGQYMLLHLPGVPGPRAYSMCSQPNEEGEWRFLIKRVPEGKGSEYLFDHIRPGQKITLDGPYGLAYFREDIDREIVCVAGGSGLAPLISIATAAAYHPAFKERRIRFFFGGRGPADICGDDYLRLLPGFGDRITFHSSISVPEMDPNNMWVGPVGFIHESVEGLLGDKLQDYEYYIAGPPPMLQATLQMLAIKHKVNVEHIHFDRFF